MAYSAGDRRSGARADRARARPEGARLVRRQRARDAVVGTQGPRRPLRVRGRRLRGRGGLPAARDQPDRSRPRRAVVHVPLGERAGGLPPARRSSAARRRGRGAPAPRMGLRALPCRDEARDRRRRRRTVPTSLRRRPRPLDRPGLGCLHRGRRRAAPRRGRRVGDDRPARGVRAIPSRRADPLPGRLATRRRDRRASRQAEPRSATCLASASSRSSHSAPTRSIHAAASRRGAGSGR